MAGFTRKQFATASLATLASINVVRSPARAAQFKLKLGCVVGRKHPISERAFEISRLIARESKNRIDLQVFPHGILGTNIAMSSQLDSDALQFQVIEGAVFGNMVPVAAISSVAYAFQDSAHALDAADGELGRYVHKELLAKGFYAYERCCSSGMFQITSSRGPIASVADLLGLKIRTRPAKIALDFFESLGATPIPMDLNQTYAALKAKTVDAQENSFTNIALTHLNEVQSNLSVTNHMWSTYWILGNMEAWKALPRDLQVVMERNFGRLVAWARHDVALQNVSSAQKLARLGLTTNQPAQDTFRAKLGASGFYKTWRAEFGETAWNALEKYAGKLA